MITDVSSTRGSPSAQAAFSLVELIVAVGIATIIFAGLYTTLAFSFEFVRVTREDLRATQIMEQKMETIRLYNWEQITTTNFIPKTFTDVFFPGPTTSPGLTYTGTVTLANVSMTERYSNDLRSINVKLSWQSGKMVRSRQMQTLVSRYGLQNYIY